MLWESITDISAYFGSGSEAGDEVPCGFTSSWFSVRELAAALAAGGAGGEWSERALSRAAGAAAAAARAVLAPDVAARGLSLALGARGLRLHVTRAAAHAPPLWFDDAALAALRMPFLTLDNIKGGRRYECHECGAHFERPNPLKLHLFLQCARPSAAAFWARALPLLAAAAGRPSPAGLATCDGHRCVYCGKLYSRKYGLKIHIRTHTGYKPLRCRYCARAFGDPSNLNKHVRLHAAAADARALACPLCGQRLARRRDLERHLRARHAPAAALATT